MENRALTYEEFLTSKIRRHSHAGFEVEDLHPELFDFQAFIVRKALKKGRYAIFADCGLGKTFMQLEWARRVAQHTGKPVLILCPLAVAGQTIKEGERFGIKITRWTADHAGSIQIANYEQLDNIDWHIYSGVVLDESSILKNVEGAYRSLIITAFALTPYKLACTATPAPNDPMELGNHAEFLNVMSRTEMLSMYFVHDGGETAKWRIKGHAVERFYKWVSEWAIMLTKPQDIGFNSEGYQLPPLNYIERQITTPQREGKLFNNVAISATNFNQELRITRVERMDQVAEIVNASKDSFIVWIKQNEEGQLLKKLIPDAVEVTGSDEPEYKEEKLLGFADNQFRVLITKTKIAQFGLNYQNCHNQIFASLDFSFEGLYQAIRRSYRFGQTQPVNIYIVTTDTMQNVVASIKRKQRQFEHMQLTMSKVIHD
jgi:superfamily II DNA or RNA helicase